MNIYFYMRKIFKIITMALLLCQPLKADNYEWEKLIKAISAVESNHNPKAVSKNGKFVGILQISKGLVDDCNRIIGEKKYTYKCRYDKNKSVEMFNIIQSYYNPSKDMVFAIRMWKGGPNWKKNTIPTKEYYRKVMNEYRKIGKGS